MRLRDLFTGRKNRGEDQPAPAPLNLNRYPPDDPGIDAISPQQMLDDQKALLVRIERALGIPDNEYDPIFPPMFVRLASFMHLLPASRERHHARIGGLFRHSLEVGLYTLEGVEGNDLTAMMQGTPQKRRNQRPRWRGAALMAGLLHDIAKPYTDLTVIDGAGRTWSPHFGGLYDWLVQHKIDRYYIEYRAQRQGNHDVLQGAFVDHVITRDFAYWLDEFGGDIYLQFRMAVTGQGGNRKLHDLVANADQRSVAKDIKIHKGLTGPGLGVSQAQQVVDVMRRLIHESRWQVNRPGGRLWIIGDGGARFAHIAWQKGYEEVLNTAMRDRNIWLPTEPSTMAEMLIERGVAEPFVDEGGQSLYWPIKGVSTTGKMLYTLRVPADVLFPDLIPPLAQCYVADEGGEQSSAGESTDGDADQRVCSRHDQAGPAQTTAGPGDARNPEAAREFGSDSANSAVADTNQGGGTGVRPAQGERDEVSRPEDESGTEEEASASAAADKKRVGQGVDLDEDKHRHGKVRTTANGENSCGDSRREPKRAEPEALESMSAAPNASEYPTEQRSASGERHAGVAPGEARAWLERHSRDSRDVLMPWFDEIMTGSKKALVEKLDRRLEIQWPESAKGIGAPKDILTGLERMGALDTGGGVGGKVTRKPNGQMVVVIKPNVTRKLLAMGAGGTAPQPQAPASAGETPSEEGDEFRRSLRAALPEIATRSEDGAFFLVTLKSVQKWNNSRRKPLRAYMVLTELSAVAEAEKRGHHFAIPITGK